MPVLSQMFIEILDRHITEAKLQLWLVWASFCRWFIFCCPYCGSLLKRCNMEWACGIIWCPCCCGTDYCPGWEDELNAVQ